MRPTNLGREQRLMAGLSRPAARGTARPGPEHRATTRAARCRACHLHAIRGGLWRRLTVTHGQSGHADLRPRLYGRRGGVRVSHPATAAGSRPLSRRQVLTKSPRQARGLKRSPLDFVRGPQHRHRGRGCAGRLRPRHDMRQPHVGAAAGAVHGGYRAVRLDLRGLGALPCRPSHIRMAGTSSLLEGLGKRTGGAGGRLLWRRRGPRSPWHAPIWSPRSSWPTRPARSCLV